MNYLKSLLIVLMTFGAIHERAWSQNKTTQTRPDSIFINDNFQQDEKIGHQKILMDSSDIKSKTGKPDDSIVPSRAPEKNKESVSPSDTFYMDPTRPKYPKDSIP